MTELIGYVMAIIFVLIYIIKVKHFCFCLVRLKMYIKSSLASFEKIYQPTYNIRTLGLSCPGLRLATNQLVGVNQIGGYKEPNPNPNIFSLVFVSYNRIRIVQKRIRVLINRIRILDIYICFKRNRIHDFNQIIHLIRISGFFNRMLTELFG